MTTQENVKPVGPQRQLPCGDLLKDRNMYLKVCVPLYNASLRGNWEALQDILSKHKDLDLLEYAITQNYDTPLHIAASAKNSKAIQKFVQNLVSKMTVGQLELKNDKSYTALAFAAAAGNLKIVMIMLLKNPNLVNIPTGGIKVLPLYWASLFGNKEMITYLYHKSDHMKGSMWTVEHRGWVLEKCIAADMFDLALDIVYRYRDGGDNYLCFVNEYVLEILAKKTDAFKLTKPCFIRTNIRRFFTTINVKKVGRAENSTGALKLLSIIWEKCLMTSSEDEVNEIISGPADTTPIDLASQEDQVRLLGTISEKITNLHGFLHTNLTPPVVATPADDGQQVQHSTKNYNFRILFSAVEMGNTGFVVELIRQYPDLIWKKNEHNQTIFHVAVLFRHQHILNLLEEICPKKNMITAIKDDQNNNMLHLAGRLPNEQRLQVVSGAAMQMHRELLWFKQVETIIPSSYRQSKNKDGLTPHEVFSKEHKELMSAGEKWMKVTASQSMVVAALITTVVFAAAFTIPGGYNQNNGIPMFLHNRAFLVFVISDAISLTCSSISILIFLSILTSRYAEDDFLHFLPRNLLLGLGTLFLSIATMMVSFGGSFFVLYRSNLIWVSIVICVIASLPVFFYIFLQSKLLMDVYHSTNGYKNLFKPKQFMVYY